jgi:predicted nucleotidyltransferase
MLESLQKAKRSLRKRTQRFLTTDLYGRREVGEFCKQVGEIGDLAIFGGMLRDLLLEGNEKFRSDVDLVIDTDNIASLQRVLAPYSPHRTAFGGYRISLRKWTVDLWPLQWTWAIRSGHVRSNSLSDLTRTTFFNWDAIVYELRSGAIHCPPCYSDELNSRLLSINLAVNPNPEGAAIRALRMAVTKQARLSFVLAEYVADVLESVGVDALLQKEQRTHRPLRISAKTMNCFLDSFRTMKAAGSTEPMILTAKQVELDLSFADRSPHAASADADFDSRRNVPKSP